MTRQQSAWTETDLRALRTYHAKVGNLELAEILGGRHSVAAIKSEASRLGLKKTGARKAQVGRENRQGREAELCAHLKQSRVSVRRMPG